MLTLALDTSGKTQSLALLENGELLSQSVQDSSVSHSEILLPAIDALLSKASLRLEDIELFALAAGPGSFTGLRIGISTVKAFCQVKPRPVAAVSTLMAMAWPFLQKQSWVAAGLEAGQGEFFSGVYQLEHGFPQSVIEDKLFSHEEFLRAWQSLPQEKYCVGKIFQNFSQDSALLVSVLESGEQNATANLAASIAVLAEKMWKKGLTISAEALKPLYLRRSEAENRLLKSLKTNSPA